VGRIPVAVINRIQFDGFANACDPNLVEAAAPDQRVRIPKYQATGVETGLTHFI